MFLSIQRNTVARFEWEERIVRQVSEKNLIDRCRQTVQIVYMSLRFVESVELIVPVGGATNPLFCTQFTPGQVPVRNAGESCRKT